MSEDGPLQRVRENSKYEPLLRPKMPELDAIRGIAILGVVIYHGLFAPTLPVPRWLHALIMLTWAGRLGVNLFFVLSGFLITGILLDSRERPDYYKKFYFRRALRIFPIYFVVLGTLLLRGYSRGFVALSFVYLSNLAPLFGLLMEYSVLWSLAVEEHFYLIWPAVVRRLSPAALLRICAVVILVSPLVRLITFTNSSADWSYYTWNNADGLACGAFLSLFIRKTNQSREDLKLICWALFYLAVLIWAIGWPMGIITRRRPFGASMQVVPWQFLFVALLGVFLLVGTTDRKKFVQSRVLIFFGYISYGLYLIHLLVFHALGSLSGREYMPGMGHGIGRDILVQFLYAGTLAVLIAWLSRKYFEGPILRLR